MVNPTGVRAVVLIIAAGGAAKLPTAMRLARDFGVHRDDIARLVLQEPIERSAQAYLLSVMAA